VKERPLAGGVDEDDGRRRWDVRIAENPGSAYAALVQEFDEHVAEGIDSHLAHDFSPKSELGERACRVEGATATFDGYHVDDR